MADKRVNIESREKETPQHVCFLCVSVMDLIFYLPVENLPCSSVVNGSRPVFFFRHYNSSLCCAVIKILLFNELSCKMKLIMKKNFMIAFLSAVLIIFFLFFSLL